MFGCSSAHSDSTVSADAPNPHPWHRAETAKAYSVRVYREIRRTQMRGCSLRFAHANLAVISLGCEGANFATRVPKVWCKHPSHKRMGVCGKPPNRWSQGLNLTRGNRKRRVKHSAS